MTEYRRMMETRNLIIGKAKYEDWESMYRNVWSRAETARYMAWQVTASEEEARLRMQRTIEYEETHDTWLVYDKVSGQAIGFAGVGEIRPQTFQDTGIALGPEYVGRGYGKQILRLLIKYCTALGGREFIYSTRAGNAASKALALSCGFRYQYSKQETDTHSGKSYELEVYRRKLYPGTGTLTMHQGKEPSVGGGQNEIEKCINRSK